MPTLLPLCQVKPSIDAVQEELNGFISAAEQPALVEPGQEPLPLVAGAYVLEQSAGRLFVEVWTRDRTLSRRITGVLARKRHSLQLSIERFGKREGTLDVVDLAAPRSTNTTRKASRQTYREQFRRSLMRQYPGWKIAELSTEPDLENSLSPAYPRALLRKGSSALAAIGCPPEALDVEGALTFGLIWLDYLRRRETKLGIQGLAVFVPYERHKATCLRLLHLRTDQGEWSAFAYTDRIEDRVDLRDYGNIDTVLPVRGGSVDAERAWWTEKLSSAPYVTTREEQAGQVSWTVHGLEFARWSTRTGLTFGVETKRRGTESNVPEIKALAKELGRFRSSNVSDRSNPLYLKKPELWLEAQAVSAVREIDASLEAEPVYRQAPAFAGGERSILDLLAVDHAGRLAVVEIKTSEDLHLPLQALDYWIRVRWHAAQDDFKKSGYFPGVAVQSASPRLILVAPALSFHPTTEALIHYFSTEVSVDTIGLAMNWREQVKVMFRKTRASRP